MIRSMTLIIPLLVNLALLVAAFKFNRWVKRQKWSGRLRWRRRLSFMLFFAAPIVWVATLVLPEAVAAPFQVLDRVGKGVDAAIAWTTTAAKEGAEAASGMGLLALKPLVTAMAYAAVGFVLGWPLDRVTSDEPEPESQD